MPSKLVSFAVGGGFACGFAAFLLLSGCAMSSAQATANVTDGDPQRGRAAIDKYGCGTDKYGCGTCHGIPGIRTAHGLVGPPLVGIRDRMYVAGVLPNTPDALVQWIRDPKSVNTKTLMPALGVSTQDATDIAAYIYSIP
jgi:cytochrome c2